jgi:hypothetical protein
MESVIPHVSRRRKEMEDKGMKKRDSGEERATSKKIH